MALAAIALRGNMADWTRRSNVRPPYHYTRLERVLGGLVMLCKWSNWTQIGSYKPYDPTAQAT